MDTAQTESVLDRVRARRGEALPNPQVQAEEEAKAEELGSRSRTAFAKRLWAAGTQW